MHLQISEIKTLRVWRLWYVCFDRLLTEEKCICETFFNIWSVDKSSWETTPWSQGCLIFTLERWSWGNCPCSYDFDDHGILKKKRLLNSQRVGLVNCIHTPYDAWVQACPSPLGFNTCQPGTHVSHGQSLEQGLFSVLSMADGSRGVYVSCFKNFQGRLPDGALADVSSWMPQVLCGTGNTDNEYRRGGTNRCIHRINSASYLRWCI